MRERLMMHQVFDRLGWDKAVWIPWMDTVLVKVIRRLAAVCEHQGTEVMASLVHNLDTQLGTIGFLEISGGQAEATIWQLTDEGIAPFDWSKWRRPR